MENDNIRRLSTVAGACAFVLALLILALRTSPEKALVYSLGMSILLGLFIYMAWTLVSVVSAGTASESSGGGAKRAGPLDETREISPEEIAAGDLDKTIELSSDEVARALQEGRERRSRMDFVLPELSPEEIFSKLEGVEMDDLPRGIEGTQSARDNVEQRPEEPRG